MNIVPIGIMNNFRAVNFKQSKPASNVLSKNIGVDTVSFSGKKANASEPRYKFETRNNAKLCQGGENKLDEKSAFALAILDSKTNKIIDMANKINSEAEKLRQQAKSSYKNGNIDLSVDASELPENYIKFNLTLKNGDTAQVLYDTQNDEPETISGEKIGSYYYDNRTGKSNGYSSVDHERVINFSDDGIDGYDKTPNKETEFYIRYNFLDEISWANIEESFYDNKTDPYHDNPVMIETLAKSAVCPEHDGQAAYALTQVCSHPSNPNAQESRFLQWISYLN